VLAIATLAVAALLSAALNVRDRLQANTAHSSISDADAHGSDWSG
jgi:hypothetical protein